MHVKRADAKDFFVIEEILMSRLDHYRPSFVKKLVYHSNLYPNKKKLQGLSKSDKTMKFLILLLSVLNNSKSKIEISSSGSYLSFNLQSL